MVWRERTVDKKLALHATNSGSISALYMVSQTPPVVIPEPDVPPPKQIE